MGNELSLYEESLKKLVNSLYGNQEVPVMVFCSRRDVGVYGVNGKVGAIDQLHITPTAEGRINETGLRRKVRAIVDLSGDIAQSLGPSYDSKRRTVDFGNGKPVPVIYGSKRVH